MRLCRALPDWLPDLPYLVVEDLHDEHDASGPLVALNGTAHAERIPFLRKIYLIEPSVRQVVRANCLRKVSRISPSLLYQFTCCCTAFVSWWLFLFLFAGARFARFLVLHSSGCPLPFPTIFTHGPTNLSNAGTDSTLPGAVGHPVRCLMPRCRRPTGACRGTAVKIEDLVVPERSRR